MCGSTVALETAWARASDWLVASNRAPPLVLYVRAAGLSCTVNQACTLKINHKKRRKNLESATNSLRGKREGAGREATLSQRFDRCIAGQFFTVSNFACVLLATKWRNRSLRCCCSVPKEVALPPRSGLGAWLGNDVGDFLFSMDASLVSLQSGFFRGKEIQFQNCTAAVLVLKLPPLWLAARLLGLSFRNSFSSQKSSRDFARFWDSYWDVGTQAVESDFVFATFSEAFVQSQIF